MALDCDWCGRAVWLAARLLAAAVVPAMLSLGGGAHAQAPALEPLAVEVVGASEPVLCAEKDNFTLTLAAPTIRAFRIEATHPAYLSGLQRDSFEADWTACDMASDPRHASTVTVPTRRTLYEEPDFWLVGWTMPTYWRPATATVRVGGRTETGLHLLQLWMIRPMGGEEVLVVYPQDGYWRLRPLAPHGLAPTAFGSSFLLGPVEVDGRPLVKLKDLAFEPATRTFTLSFERGGSATLRLAKVDQNRASLEAAFDPPVSGRPFAALRSMYVTEFNNDVARIAVREKAAKGWREEPVMAFRKATATDLWAGRTSVSRHNSSSPDMAFTGFQGELANKGVTVRKP